jgi:hypothetical protein
MTKKPSIKVKNLASRIEVKFIAMFGEQQHQRIGKDRIKQITLDLAEHFAFDVGRANRNLDVFARTVWVRIRNSELPQDQQISMSQDRP